MTDESDVSLEVLDANGNALKVGDVVSHLSNPSLNFVVHNAKPVSYSEHLGTTYRTESHVQIVAYATKYDGRPYEFSHYVPSITVKRKRKKVVP